MKTCLIVDDEATMRKAQRLLIDALQLGFEVIEAEDGEKGLEICRKQLPDVILLDWNMPVVGGYEFLLTLRGLREGDKPKVIVCTGDGDAATILKARHAGANEYLVKPFQSSMLVAKLHEVGFD